jgi:hypothetical protein
MPILLAKLKSRPRPIRIANMLASTNSFHPLRGPARRSGLLGIVTLTTGLCLLTPATSGAHKGSQLESGVPNAVPLQETNTGSTTETGTETSPTTPSHEGHARHGRRDTNTAAGCSVSLETTTPTAAAAAPLALVGTLVCPEGVSASEQTVTLYQKAAHTPGFSVAVTATTEADGAFQFALPGVEVDNVFFVRCDGVRSAHVKVKVALQVDIEAPATGARLLAASSRVGVGSASAAANAVTITGTVSPDQEGDTVTLQREARDGAWHFIGRGHVGEEGKFSITHTFFARGEAHIRVVVHSHGLYMASASAPVTYQISYQHQKTTAAVARTTSNQ